MNDIPDYTDHIHAKARAIARIADSKSSLVKYIERALLAERMAERARTRTFTNGPCNLGYGAADHLSWIADRLQHIHGENPNYDYMIRLREIADLIRNQDKP